MKYLSYYTSPLGNIFLSADERGLSGLWFEGQKGFIDHIKSEYVLSSHPFIVQTKKWLDKYFSGEILDFSVPLHFVGTEFQKEVWKILTGIPYGQTRTYGDIAAEIAGSRGLARMSAQAVGGAVAKNHISIIVPCHRVIGASGALTGYAGGIDRKKKLLQLEKHEINESFQHGIIEPSTNIWRSK